MPKLSNARIKILNIQRLSLNSDKEVICKIVKEILTLFKVEIIDENAPFDYELLNIENTFLSDHKGIATKLELINKDKKLSFTKEAYFNNFESLKSGTNRLIKLNLYNIFTKDLGYKKAPWGILHGVRPLKIVDRYIKDYKDKQLALANFEKDFLISKEKNALVFSIYDYQKKYLATEKEKVSIYIGIPFCQTRCLYCSFPSMVRPKDEIIDYYLHTLEKEFLFLKETIEKHNLNIESIYIGGGTPTSLNYLQLNHLLAMVDKYLTFSKNIEYTVEAGRPDSIDIEKMGLLKYYGVNRVSINPQTMIDSTLRLIGRNHSSDDIKKAFSITYKAGIENINADLILGLPTEGEDEAKYTIEEVLKLKPKDITIHALAIKKGSILKENIKTTDLPSDDIVQRMSQIMYDKIFHADFVPYYLYRQGYMSGQLENIGFAKKGYESIYNIKIMSETQTILGIGACSSTKIVMPNKKMMTNFNPKDLKTYFETIDSYIDKRRILIDNAFL